MKVKAKYDVRIVVEYDLPDKLIQDYHSCNSVEESYQTELYNRMKNYEKILERYLITMKHIKMVDVEFKDMDSI